MAAVLVAIQFRPDPGDDGEPAIGRDRGLAENMQKLDICGFHVSNITE